MTKKAATVTTRCGIVLTPVQNEKRATIREATRKARNKRKAERRKTNG
jgi:hypothetical protein